MSTICRGAVKVSDILDLRISQRCVAKYCR